MERKKRNPEFSHSLQADQPSEKSRSRGKGKKRGKENEAVPKKKEHRFFLQPPWSVHRGMNLKKRKRGKGPLHPRVCRREQGKRVPSVLGVQPFKILAEGGKKKERETRSFQAGPGQKK